MKYFPIVRREGKRKTWRLLRALLRNNFYYLTKLERQLACLLECSELDFIFGWKVLYRWMRLWALAPSTVHTSLLCLVVCGLVCDCVLHVTSMSSNVLESQSSTYQNGKTLVWWWLWLWQIWFEFFWFQLIMVTSRSIWHFEYKINMVFVQLNVELH